MRDVNPIIKLLATKIDDWIELLCYYFHNESKMNKVCVSFDGLKMELEKQDILYSPLEWRKFIITLGEELRIERTLEITIDMNKEAYLITLPKD